MSGVVLLNLLSIFSTKSSLKPSVSSRIQSSPISTSLSHHRLAADMSIFYFYFNGHCSLEIKNITPHPFQVTRPNPRTLAHKSYFIPRTSLLWNSLQSIIFPESYNLSSLKSNINKLDPVSPFFLNFLPFPFSWFSFVGALL